MAEIRCAHCGQVTPDDIALCIHCNYLRDLETPADAFTEAPKEAPVTASHASVSAYLSPSFSQDELHEVTPDEPSALPTPASLRPEEQPANLQSESQSEFQSAASNTAPSALSAPPSPTPLSPTPPAPLHRSGPAAHEDFSATKSTTEAAESSQSRAPESASNAVTRETEEATPPAPAELPFAPKPFLPYPSRDAPTAEHHETYFESASKTEEKSEAKSEEKPEKPAQEDTLFSQRPPTSKPSASSLKPFVTRFCTLGALLLLAGAVVWGITTHLEREEDNPHSAAAHSGDALSPNALAGNGVSDTLSNIGSDLAQPAIVQFEVSKPFQEQGRWFVNINWRTRNATRVLLDVGTGPQALKGTFSNGQFPVGKTKQINLIAYNAAGQTVGKSQEIRWPEGMNLFDDSGSGDLDRALVSPSAASAGAGNAPSPNAQPTAQPAARPTVLPTTLPAKRTPSPETQSTEGEAWMAEDDVDLVSRHASEFDYRSIYKESRTEILGELTYFQERFEKADAKTLRLYRNAIFARRGLKFKAAELKSTFDKRSWYTPSSSDQSFLYDNVMTQQERDNINFIKSLEAKRGGKVQLKGKTTNQVPPPPTPFPTEEAGY
jgi:hypothetical protein